MYAYVYLSVILQSITYKKQRSNKKIKAKVSAHCISATAGEYML